jgi:Tfp pilus assembly protein PilO
MNINLNELDLADVARWPTAARAVVILFLMGGVIFLGYWFHTKDQQVELESAEVKE